jgi:GDP-4-dehydro-6-deoxy-D-mannose reductase
VPTTLVTGAAGFVGGHLLPLLCRERGRRVVAWYRPGEPPAMGRGEGLAVEWRAVELAEAAAVADAAADAGPDQIYHLAGAAHVGQSWQETDTSLSGNVLATHRLFEGVRQARLRPRVLVTASSTVYAASDAPLDEDARVQPTNPYALSKLAQERLARRAGHELGVEVVTCRSFNHIGPGQSPGFFAPAFARQVARIEAGLAEPRLRVGNLDARRDLTDVRDTVAAYVALMRRGEAGNTYNVCSGRAHRVGDILGWFVAAATCPIGVETDPALLRPNDVPLVVGSHARLTTATGWTPQIPLETTLGDILEDWRVRVRT